MEAVILFTYPMPVPADLPGADEWKGLLFLEVKAATGCRLYDICSLLSAQLQAGRIVFPEDQTKGRKERKVPLPPELFAALDKIKGPPYLWESHPEGLKEALKKKGWPRHQIDPAFHPRRLYFGVESWFADYRAGHPERQNITSHMFRKRAFTSAWEAKIDPRKAAIAIGCNVDTMMKHYVKMDEQAATDEVFAALSPRLAIPAHDPSGQTAQETAAKKPPRSKKFGRPGK